MQWKYHSFRMRIIASVLFLSSLIGCVGSSYGWRFNANFDPCPVMAAQVADQITDGEQQIQQGVEAYQQGVFLDAIAHWQTALKHYQSVEDHTQIALIEENLARAYQQVGQHTEALQHWQAATQLYQQLGDRPQLGRMLTEQAQTYRQLGQYQRAIALLCTPAANHCSADSALTIAQDQGDVTGTVAALGTLGEVSRLQAEYDLAINWLDQGLALAQKHDLATIDLLNSLGNTYASRARWRDRKAASLRTVGDDAQAKSLMAKANQDHAQALESFETSLRLARQAKNLAAQLRSLLNSIPVYQRLDINQAQKAHTSARSLLEQLPDSQAKVFAALTLAQINPALGQEATAVRPVCLATTGPSQGLMETALTVARRIGDQRSESFALGQLGHFWECQQDYDTALVRTQEAQAAAETLDNRDSLYLWQWQAGRIYDATNQHPKALNAYQQALNTLDKIRSEIVAANRDQRLDFRETVEPIYRQLAALSLSQASLDLEAVDPTTAETVLGTMDRLQLALLQNYFGNDCVITALPALEQGGLDQTAKTAVFNTILFQDRMAVILTLPGQPQKLAWVEDDLPTVKQTINHYRRQLERHFSLTPYNKRLSQQLYEWFIQPFAADLAAAQIETLVFVQDGVLRTVPMASLHDGQRYLIETYAITTTPSLALTAPQALDKDRLSILALGLTEPATVNGQYFPPLDHVQTELNHIAAQLPESQVFLNQAFTGDRIAQVLQTNRHNIVHLATHAEFGPEPEDTFLVTGNNSKLTLNAFDTLIRENTDQSRPLDLLILTACQTAVGDDRAALGLAGVAIQAGTKSVLASLWSINDQTTAQFVDHFYTALRQPGVSKAQALQRAQLEILKTRPHPGYWSSFILIGNWL
ncbi:CHAT domain-containing protein [Acaryochloris sp. IP29b_bin.148]|uniref:CHAT domain-containing protein n=1 Tax=Acaryochloris sp. IP29b_bin.148 TaxID=2969218 RepID=UPI002624F5AA|nr:CHAT domain-containing protein [Acaryochloris sp. IP29b_bin.148]